MTKSKATAVLMTHMLVMPPLENGLNLRKLVNRAALALIER